MSNETKRVMVPITPEVQAVFERLAAAQGCTTGRAISEWLTDTLEGAAAIADLVEKARREPIAAMRQMHSYALGLGDMTTEILEGLRKAMGFKKINILGHSYGGVVAQGYAVKYPENVSHLILANSFHSYLMWQANDDNCNHEIKTNYLQHHKHDVCAVFNK